MLASIEGTISDLLDEVVVVDVNGLGYGLAVPQADRAGIKAGQAIRLYVYEHIREDTHDLYGFRDLEDHWLFKQLISVSGIGPKLALTVLSGIGSKQLRQAIVGASSDVLESIPGVGKRTAERLVVELRNRMGDALEATAVSDGGDTVFAALRQLGYPAPEAQAAASQVPADIEGDEARLKHALKELAK